MTCDEDFLMMSYIKQLESALEQAEERADRNYADLIEAQDEIANLEEIMAGER